MREPSDSARIWMEKLPYRELAAPQNFLLIHCETPDESSALSLPRKLSGLRAKIMSAESFPFEMYQSTIRSIVFFWQGEHTPYTSRLKLNKSHTFYKAK